MTDAMAQVGAATAAGYRPSPLDGTVGQVDKDLFVEWDFDNDGEYNDSEYENITTYVLSGSYRAGRDYPSQLLGRSTPGQLRLQLSNLSGRFSPTNAKSPLNLGGRALKAGRRIRIRTAEAVPELAYPGWSGNIVTCGPADDFPTQLALVGNYDILDVSGDHQADTTLASIGRPMYIRGDGVETTTLPRLATSNPVSGLWLSGFTVRRDQEIVDTTRYYGIRSSGGALTNFRFFDLKVTGHGLNRGIDLPSSYLNDRGVVHNVLVEEIENVAFYMFCDNLRTWSLEARKLYRTWDVNSGDVDVFRMFGDNHRHTRLWFHEIDNTESISTENTGSFSEPHTDCAQFFQTVKPGGGDWTLNNCTIEDSVFDIPAGDQALTVQSTNVAFNLVDGLTLRNVLMRGISTGIINLDGVDNFTMDSCTIWLDQDFATTQFGLVFGTFWGAGTNPGAVITRNTLYAQDANQHLYWTPENNVDEGTDGNKKVVGDPPASTLQQWVAPKPYRPTDLEVEAWLTDGAPTIATNDPLPLLRDRFSGTGDIDASSTEDGKTWTLRSGGFSRGGGEVANTDQVDFGMATVDLGRADYYIQARCGELNRANRAGIVIRYVDNNNFELVYLRNGSTSVAGSSVNYLAFEGGVVTAGNDASIERRSGMVVGVKTKGGTATVYVDGVEMFTQSLVAGNTSETNAGIYSRWNWQGAPTIDEVFAWSDIRRPQDGVLWSGTVTRVESERSLEGEKTATVLAEGELARLDRDTGSPASIGEQVGLSVGTTPGLAIGNVLARVGALHPPHPLDTGDVTLGGFSFDRAKAITQVRRFEDAEIGFLYEPPEGGIRFDDRSARDGGTVKAVFTDSPADGEVRPTSVRVRSSQRDIINRVTSEVAPTLPRVAATVNYARGTAASANNDVEVTLSSSPTAEAGDLALVVFASTVQEDGVPWLNPPGWTNLRPTFDELGQTRIYAKRLEAGDLGANVVFFADTGNAGGSWIGTVYLIRDWHGTVTSGVALAGPTGFGAPATTSQAQAGTNDPPAMLTPWGRSPSLFIAHRVGMVSSGSGPTLAAASDEWAPNGFESLQLTSDDATAGSAYDVAMQRAFRNDSAGVVNPSPFTGDFDDFDYLETFVVAVRPNAGDPPPASGGTEITDNNVVSQHDHGVIVEHRNPATIMSTAADARAYNNSLLTRFDQDRPIVRIGFHPMVSYLHRAKARTLRLSDRIRVVDAEEGVDDEFHIENISATFSAERGWQMFYDCSPAADSGGGADEITEDEAVAASLSVVGSPEWAYDSTAPSVTNPDANANSNTVLAIALGQGTSNSPTITVVAPPGVTATELTGLAVTNSDIRVRAWTYPNDGAATKTFGYTSGADNRSACILIPLDGAASAIAEGGTPVTGTGPIVAFPTVATQVGDLVIPFAGRRANSETAGSMSGYTVVDDDTGEANNPQGVAWEAIADSTSETPPSVTWSGSAGEHAHAVVAFRA